MTEISRRNVGCAPRTGAQCAPYKKPSNFNGSCRLLALGVAFAACLIASLPAQAQHKAHTARLPADTLPPPNLMDGIGTGSIDITTDSELAQKYFDQGLNLLHCFWDFEAYRAFKEAVRQDKSAAMAYWGVFMALNYNQAEQLEARLDALAKAEALAPAASGLEQRYIRAITALNQAGDPAAGKVAFVREMEALIERYPQEVEAKLFLVKFLVTEVGGGGHSTRPGEAGESGFDRARDLLRPLLQSHPSHLAVHHYWIHVHEYGPTPEAALASVEKVARLAPKSGHILHMPGHIYYQVGEYEKAYQAFQASLRFDQAYLEKTGLEPIDHWNYTHNLDYLVANCAEDGRYAEGQRWAKLLSGLRVEIERSEAVGLGFIVYGGRTAPVRLHMRYGNWEAAAKLLEEHLATWRFPSQISADYLGGLHSYNRGMAALERGDAGVAAQRFQQLLGLSIKMAQQEVDLGSDWYYEGAKRILAIGAVELRGLVLSSQGQHDQAIEQLKKAVVLEAGLGYGEPPHYSRPVRESLAAVYRAAGRWREAIESYEKVFEERPNSGHVWYGIARTHVAAGQKPQAREAYERFLRAWQQADSDLPQVRQARAWLAANP